MTAYYNEFDPQTAAWLRVLIAEGHIAPGVVDERSIEDVRPSDLRGFDQCHFFAGIGVWSYALRRAGWRDNRPVWTGSCPCQPFSAAGKGAGFADERHLWPSFQWLIQECKPAIVLGEQVASAPVDDWIDLVHADLEALDYTFGSVPFPAASVGAPHIRDRNYWVAHTLRKGSFSSTHSGVHRGEESAGARNGESERLCHVGGLANAGSTRPQEQWVGWQQPARLAEVGIPGGMGNASGQGLDKRERERGILGAEGGAVKGKATVGAGVHVGRLADREGDRWREQRQDTAGCDQRSGAQELGQRPGRSGVFGAASGGAGPTNGFWSDADWLGCRDGKWRPVEPGTFPLADGAAARVVRLRGYGNAVNAEQARAWIETVMECLPC